MKKRKITVALILSAVMLIGSTLCVYAATTGFNSRGKIVFNGNDGTPDTADDITFDSADLNTIYNAVASPRQTLAGLVNSQGNAKLISSNALTTDINALRFGMINTQLEQQFSLPAISSALYFDLTNGLTTNNTSDSQSVIGGAISGTDTMIIDNIEYILVDEMSAGVTAWDSDGRINIGTGAEDNKYYNNGYLKGVADEKARILSSSHIVYKFHVHTNTDGGVNTTELDTINYTGENKPNISSTKGGCYQIPVYHHHTGNATTGGGCYRAVYHQCDGLGEYDGTSGDEIECPKCHRTIYEGPYYEEYLGQKCGAYVFDHYELSCGHSENEVEGYSCNCGHTHGELISASLTY